MFASVYRYFMHRGHDFIYQMKIKVLINDEFTQLVRREHWHNTCVHEEANIEDATK